MKWYIENGPSSDVAVSTRIRLARNLEGYPFHNKMTLDQKNEVIHKVYTALKNSNSAISNKFKIIKMDDISERDACSMVERHLISIDMTENPEGSAAVLLDDESVCIMINEEDHIRIQVLHSGLDFESAYDIADHIDTLLEQNLHFAFDKKLGYLTECPTNLGTGLRASIMLHLPALEMVGAIKGLASMVSKIGLTIRGSFGEGSDPYSSMYQLSNQVTLGVSEKGAIDNLKGIATQIIERERTARSGLDHTILEDKIFRSIGILKNARILGENEFSQLISFARLGVAMGILDISMEQISRMLLDCQYYTLQKNAGMELNTEACDKIRADTVRSVLS